jgi:hypothetical protein
MSHDTLFPIKHVVTKPSAGMKRAYKINHLCQVWLPYVKKRTYDFFKSLKLTVNV